MRGAAHPKLDVALAFLELGDKYDVQHLKLLSEGQMLRQLDRKNMVEFISIGYHFRADKIFEAALKLTKANMTWLRTQVKKLIYKERWIEGTPMKIFIGEHDSF